MTDLSTHEVLVAAKGWLIKGGWQQLKWGSHTDGPFCALGAIGKVARGEVAQPAKRAVADEVGIPRDAPAAELMGWNDAPGRTFEEVIDAFDRAIWATAPKDSVSLGAELAGVA